MILLLLSLLAPPSEGSTLIGECDSYDERHKWTFEERMETRARVERACKELGASKIVCEYVDAIAVRESSGMASRRHTRGENEDGLGPLGLSLHWQRDKWPGDDEDPMFCTPEVSVIVALAIFRKAITGYNAQNILEIQAIYGGSWFCQEDREGKRRCRPVVRSFDICYRMKMRGYNCEDPITTKMLGPAVKLKDRRERAAALVPASGVAVPTEKAPVEPD